MNKQMIGSRFLEKYSSLTIEGTRDGVRGVYGILAGIMGDFKMEYEMTSIFRLKRATGIGGGKDPNKKISLVEHHQCRAYSTKLGGNNSKVKKALEELSGQKVSSDDHPTDSSIKNGGILQTNYTHSARVEGNRTMPVGKDHKGKDSFIVQNFIVVNATTEKINRMTLEEGSSYIDSLKDLSEGLKQMEECNPITDFKLANERIAYVACYYGHEWDESVETKEEVIKKLELLIEDVERIIKNNENNNKDNN